MQQRSSMSRSDALRFVLQPISSTKTTAARRMRRGRHPRPSRCRPAGLPRPLRAAASRPGIRRHRHRRRTASRQHQGHGPGVGDLHRRSAIEASRPHGHRPHALLNDRRLGAAECAAHSRGIDQGADRHRAQWQPGEPRDCAARSWSAPAPIFRPRPTPKSSSSSSPTRAPARWSTPSQTRSRRWRARSPS